MATTREEDRQIAAKGEQAYANSHFENHESVLHAGVLFAIPPLIAQGLERFFKVYNPLPKGFYGLHHMVLTMCFMALARIKKSGTTKNSCPGRTWQITGFGSRTRGGLFSNKTSANNQPG